MRGCLKRSMVSADERYGLCLIKGTSWLVMGGYRT